MLKRCHWCGDIPIYVDYHDHEWGVPELDEQILFEFLLLEGMQAGLSWITILNKRENMRASFAHFDPQKLARFNQAQINQLMQNTGIIRNKLKITSAINNAKTYLKLKEQGVNFTDFMWQFTDGDVIINEWRTTDKIPATSVESKAMAKKLKATGFNFVGETICYAFMQAVGMVNDHVTSCFRHDEICQMLE